MYTNHVQEYSRPQSSSTRPKLCPTQRHVLASRNQDSGATHQSHNIASAVERHDARVLYSNQPGHLETWWLGFLFSSFNQNSLKETCSACCSSLSGVSLVATLLDHTATLNFRICLDQVIRHPLSVSDSPSGNNMSQRQSNSKALAYSIKTCSMSCRCLAFFVQLDRLIHVVPKELAPKEAPPSLQLWG